jgi:hypothetical protein
MRQSLKQRADAIEIRDVNESTGFSLCGTSAWHCRSDLVLVLSGCGTSLLSQFRTSSPPHAALRNFFAQVEAEVTVMANEEQTRLERDVAIIEQTLRAMIEIDSTMAQLPADDTRQSVDYDTLMQ